jgi:hypothetical protein
MLDFDFFGGAVHPGDKWLVFQSQLSPAEVKTAT